MKNELTAKRLRLALSNANMKPQELANKSGVSKSSISQYVNGSHAPGNISAKKIGKVLDINPLWIMGFDVDMSNPLFGNEKINSFKNNIKSATSEFIISDLEKEIILKFRQANNGRQEAVLTLLEIEKRETKMA